MTMLQLRCAAVVAAASATATAVAALALPPVLEVVSRVRADGLTGVGFPALLVAGCASLALIGATLCWLAVGVVATEAWRTGSTTAVPPSPGRVVPARLRHAVLVACGVAALGGVFPAFATPARPGPGQATPATAVLHGLPYPDRAVDEPHLAPTPTPTSTSTSTSARVTVQPGDTLWALARDRLGDGDGAVTSDADVVRAVARWHDVNRQVIGPDPDLILPGQQLRPPAHASEPARPDPSGARGGTT